MLNIVENTTYYMYSSRIKENSHANHALDSKIDRETTLPHRQSDMILSVAIFEEKKNKR